MIILYNITLDINSSGSYNISFVIFGSYYDANESIIKPNSTSFKNLKTIETSEIGVITFFPTLLTGLIFATTDVSTYNDTIFFGFNTTAQLRINNTKNSYQNLFYGNAPNPSNFTLQNKTLWTQFDGIYGNITLFYTYNCYAQLYPRFQNAVSYTHLTLPTN